MRAIIGDEKCITYIDNDKVVILNAELGEEERLLLQKWQKEELIPCVMQVTGDAQVIVCDKANFYLNEKDFEIKETERKRLLEAIYALTDERPFYAKRVRADGKKQYAPFKWFSWNDIAIRYEKICKLVREYFGREFYEA